MALESLGGNVSRVNDAFVVVNPNSLAIFNGYRSNLSTQHALTPSLFKKDDWKSYDVMEPVDQERASKRNRLENCSGWIRSGSLFGPWLVWSRLVCLLCILSWVPSTKTRIQMSSGIYLTSTLKYAEKYATLASKESPSHCYCSNDSWQLCARGDLQDR